MLAREAFDVAGDSSRFRELWREEMLPPWTPLKFYRDYGVTEGITLDGTVPTRDQKRRAEDCVEDISGVRHVQNNLRVQERSVWDRSDETARGEGEKTTGSLT